MSEEPRRKRAKNELEKDLTAALPDKVLSSVLSYLSLRDKLRSEAVNKKFRGCVQHLLNNKPLSLEVSVKDKSLNGYAVDEFAHAVWLFAGKAKFTNVTIGTRSGKKIMETILSVLITSSNECLSQTEAINLDTSCSRAVLEEFLSKCGKLSSVQFDFEVRPLKSAADAAFFTLDLATVLKEKDITHFQIPYLAEFSHQQLLNLFGSLKPNTLRKVVLSVTPMTHIIGLVNDLAGSAWSALEELKLYSAIDVDIVAVCAALEALPNFKMFRAVLYHQRQFVPVMVSVLNNCTQFGVHCSRSFGTSMHGCEAVKEIGQIQESHPGVQVDFGHQKRPRTFNSRTSTVLTLTQGDVTFVNRIMIFKCDGGCVQCRSFFPFVLDKLAKAASARKDAHLEGYQLNQCRINRVVDHLNEREGDCKWMQALSVERNQAQGRVTITFKRGGSDQQFSITVGYGPCFSTSCIECVNVD